MAISNRQFPSVTMVSVSEGLDARIETSNGYGFLRITQDENGKTLIFGKDGKCLNHLPAPVASLSENILTWTRVDDAERYYVCVDAVPTVEVNSSTLSYDVSTIASITSGVYGISVKASNDIYKDSSVSNTCAYERIVAPTINITDNVLTWTAVVDAEKYVIMFNNTAIAEVASSASRSFNLAASTAIPITSDGQPDEVKIKAVNDTYGTSAISSGASYVKLASAVVSLVNDTLTWASVTGATSYQILIDGVAEASNATSPFDLTTISSIVPGTYGVQVKAVWSSSGSSSFSNSNTVVYEKQSSVGTFEETSWADIKDLSSNASAYWNIGDTKSITINGTIAGTSYSNLSTKVMIIDFDHDANNPNYIDGGLGITLICFRDYSGFDGDLFVSLIDDNYNTSVYDPDAPASDWTPAFIYGTDGSVDADVGTWKGSYMRNTVLGSTNVPGGSANDTELTNPKANSFMATLPSDLRSVLSPMWTDEITYYYDPEEDPESGYRYESYKGYCKLMSKKEITGTENQGVGYYYFNNESQFSWFISSYDYWAAILDNQDLETMRNGSEGGSYNSSIFWTRTPYTINYYNSYEYLSEYGSGGMAARVTSYGISPILRIGPTVNS